MATPSVLSACRSADRQALMQRLWDMGHREGLAARPADNSKHIADEFGFCRAFDLANDDLWIEVMGPVVARHWPNVEWGGTYLRRDPRHFEERG